MLESLSIKNFRNFRSLQIESLARVNLIVGRNSVGKSNLLDAVSLYVKQGDAKHLFELLEHSRECRRVAGNGYVFRETFEDALMSLFYGRAPFVYGYNDQIDIAATPANQLHKLTLRLVFCSAYRGDCEPYWTTIESFSLNTQKNEVNVIIPHDHFDGWKSHHFLFSVENDNFNWIMDADTPPDTWRFLPSNLQCHHPLQYIRTQFAQNRNNAEFWDAISLTEKEGLALDALRILLPDIISLSYKSDKQGDRIPYIKLRNQDVPVPFYSLGEGVGRILTLILHLVNAKDGTLLIDEFENGLHYTIQEPLWKMIFQIAEQLNVQVLATTHSEDCLWAFSEVLKENGHSDQGKVLRLAEVKSDIVCTSFDSHDMEKVLQKEMEIR
jgi:predicted ATPase